MKNKFILIIFMFFVLFSFLLSSFSLANFNFTGSDGKAYSLPDMPNLQKYVVIGYYSSSKRYEIESFSDFNGVTFSKTDERYLSISLKCPSTTRRVRYSYYPDRPDLGNNGLVVEVDGYSSKGSSYVWGELYANFDVKNVQGETIFEKTKINAFIVNKEEIGTGKFSKVIINAGDYTNKELYLLSYDYTTENPDSPMDVLYPRKIIPLKLLGDFYVGTKNEKAIYEVPFGHTGINLVEGNKYGFKVAMKNESNIYEYFDDVSFNIGVVSAEDKEQADKDKDFALKEENNKTNKGIWDTLKEVLSFINPFSENFFVYKLIELLINAIKGLFIPSDDFFTNWIDNMNDWLSERLGALYYPVDLVTEFLERIGDISENGTAVISGNGFEFMGAQLIPAFSYDLNSLLSNDTFENIHNIYLTVVDVILYLCLIVLAKNTFVDIFGGKYDDGVDIAMQGLSSDSSYRKYENYRNNKQRYKREHGG